MTRVGRAAAALQTNPITSDEFERALLDVCDEIGPAGMLQIPGVYEACSEALNNDAVRKAEAWREADEGEDS